MAGWHHWLNRRESEWTLGVGEGQGGLACCDSWGCRVGQDWLTDMIWSDVLGNNKLRDNCTHFLWENYFFLIPTLFSQPILLKKFWLYWPITILPFSLLIKYIFFVSHYSLLSTSLLPKFVLLIFFFMPVLYLSHCNLKYTKREFVLFTPIYLDWDHDLEHKFLYNIYWVNGLEV